jgi:hypothetical protein
LYFYVNVLSHSERGPGKIPGIFIDVQAFDDADKLAVFHTDFTGLYTLSTAEFRQGWKGIPPRGPRNGIGPYS